MPQYVGDDETGGELHDRLAALGAQTLADGLGLLRVGLRPMATAQGEAGVTYAHKLDKAEARCLELGAGKPEFQPQPNRWRVLTDPSGQPFCVCIKSS